MFGLISTCQIVCAMSVLHLLSGKLSTLPYRGGAYTSSTERTSHAAR